MKTINVGIIGFGTVGAGTLEVLTKNSRMIADRIGAQVNVKRIADLDIETDRGVPVADGVLTTQAGVILDDPQIQVVVELIGGLDRAKDYILEAMQRGKHVVTANKALLAEKGREVFEAAERNGVNLAFEASVGGGIPVLGALKRGLSANRIEAMMGILNGTSNYILTSMSQRGLPYSGSVEEAVKLGFAEDPPTLDVDGTDATHKLAILISLVFGSPVEFSRIYREGITSLSPDDIRFADEFGYAVKLLAIARRFGDRVEARVHPAMIPRDHILANVNEAFNAIYLEGDFVGPNLYYGLGAGRRPTASAVASDIMELARHIRAAQKGAEPPLGHACLPAAPVAIEPIEKLTMAYYFRFSALDRPGVLSRIAGILGEHQISIASVIQKGREVNGPVPIVMLTHEALESNVNQAISEIDSLDVLTDSTVILRVEKGNPCAADTA
jgi:homoserine dehydrogenase